MTSEVEGKQLKVRSREVRGISVHEVNTWLEVQGIDPHEITFSGGHLRWESLETDVEYQQRLDFLEKQRERTEQWERETYERLKEKFGD